MHFRRKPGSTWAEVRQRIAREFPAVPQIGTAELAAQLGGPGEQRPLLLDVRDADEFAISHLPGALHVLPQSDPRHVLAGVAHDQAVVAYCAAGIRSCRYLQRMMRLGYTNVANLDGAIFQWANEDRPLEADGRTVRQVHACEPKWAGLLREELRVLPG